MAAYLAKTDVEKWIKFARIGIQLRRFSNATYCLNRAIKQTPETNLDMILGLKFDKINIYR